MAVQVDQDEEYLQNIRKQMEECHWRLTNGPFPLTNDAYFSSRVIVHVSSLLLHYFDLIMKTEKVYPVRYPDVMIPGRLNARLDYMLHQLAKSMHMFEGCLGKLENRAKAEPKGPFSEIFDKPSTIPEDHIKVETEEPEQCPIAEAPEIGSSLGIDMDAGPSEQVEITATPVVDFSMPNLRPEAVKDEPLTDAEEDEEAPELSDQEEENGTIKRSATNIDELMRRGFFDPALLLCQFCGNNAKNRREAETHRKRSHRTEWGRLFGCGECNVYYRSFVRVAKHFNQPATKCNGRIVVRSLDEVRGGQKNGEIPADPHGLFDSRVCTCPHCHVAFSDRHMMYHHSSSAHNEPLLLFSCSLCGIASSEMYDIERHMAKKKTPSFCLAAHLVVNKANERSQNLQEIEDDCVGHEEGEGGRGATQDRRGLNSLAARCCPFCKIVCKDRFALDMHLKYHQNGQNQNLFGCSDCRHFFQNIAEIHAHFRENRFHGCVRGKLITRVAGQMSATSQTHSSTDNHGLLGLEARMCPHCGKIYESRRRLDMHMKSFHASETFAHFGCSTCLKFFVLVDGLENHFINAKGRCSQGMLILRSRDEEKNDPVSLLHSLNSAGLDVPSVSSVTIAPIPESPKKKAPQGPRLDLSTPRVKGSGIFDQHRHRYNAYAPPPPPAFVGSTSGVVKVVANRKGGTVRVVAAKRPASVISGHSIEVISVTPAKDPAKKVKEEVEEIK